MQNDFSPVAPGAQAPLEPVTMQPLLTEPPNDVPALASADAPAGSASNAPPPIAGYCRVCGKALTEQTRRLAQGTIFCEDHVPKMVTEPPSPYASAPQPAAVPSQGPSPGLAFVLGFVPGVGAIYNGQYAKGFIHVVIFGLLVSISGSPNLAGGLEPLFGLLGAAFVFYQCFEAMHTARRRQLGLPVDEWSSLVPLGTPGTAAASVGPIMLISIGILFLLNNFNLLPIDRMLRFWPLILIGAGAAMLIGRMRSSQGGQQ